MNTPEHIHLALNHLPFLGAGFALIPIIWGLVSRQRNTVLAGLLVAALSGWVTPLAMETGESAYDRYEHGPIAAYLDPQAETYLEIHEHRAEAWAKVMYASAVVTTLGFVVLLWKPGSLKPVAWISAGFCLASLASGIWIAESGGLIRRPDFRQSVEQSPPTERQRKHH